LIVFDFIALSCLAGNDAQTAAALESKTLGLYQELQKSASIPTDVGGIKAETAEGAIKTEGG
jgi:hypothetical protein